MRDTETLWTARLDADTRTLTVEDREQPRYSGRYRLPPGALADFAEIMSLPGNGRDRVRAWLDENEHGDRARLFTDEPEPLTERKAVAMLGELEPGDPEVNHGLAERILLDFLRAQGHRTVADAFEAARKRCGFWYS